ncbi:MAG: hypothetical protein ACE5IB_00170 [Candidatus Geothermarchaeales archaeon]
MGKTETIKQRTVYVYAPSEETRTRWERAAKEAGMSLSRFIVDTVDAAIREGEDSDFRSRKDLWKENVTLREANKRLADEKKMLSALVEKLEDEVRRYRTELFLEAPNKQKVRQYERDLIDILREGGVLSSEEVLDRLRIRPTDTRSAQAIRIQLENLQAYGLVKATPRGWRWVG